jgi:thymidylate kinase
MSSTATLSNCTTRQGQQPARVAEDVASSGGPGRMLLGVLRTLEQAGIAYCLLHGYESYPEEIKSDVDCVISGKLRPAELVALLHEQRALIGADVVRSVGYYIVLAGKSPDGSPCILELDMSLDVEHCNLQFYAGSEVLQSRRRHRQFWVPAAEIEFGCYLIKKIAKGNLDDEQRCRLAALYHQQPGGCRRQVARFWGAASTELIVAAANTGDWTIVQHSLRRLRAELRRRAALRHPWRALANRLCWMGRSARKAFRADAGVHIVFLGPDGAGKSSVVQAVNTKLGRIFPRTQCYRFPPSLLSRLLRRPEPPPEKQPHGSSPRSFMHSVIRAVCYWFVYYVPGYFLTIRLDLARGTLVLHDRHLIDAQVDPRRYRYGGPEWLLRLICWCVPEPHMVLLLDAPAESLQARKQEVPFEESVRQREAYRALVGSIRTGHIIDAGQPRERVAEDVCDIVLRHLKARMTSRLVRKDDA